MQVARNVAVKSTGVIDEVRARRDQGEALHLLVVAGDDRVDAEGAEAGIANSVSTTMAPPIRKPT
jgi:hypothetical protein